ncbi:MAG: helix-turn-helix domain-containing protein [Faecalibacterium sp.]|nr:helix-turn-helix domain-containing protein [Ruminococcus sp.]MCM1392434.1 helix-turn-helix domain-containing protein [Ruminococcus sp.]MCM1486193.1 helix-turn-helix domain-containing protein [Faecalibacterium sp.]
MFGEKLKKLRTYNNLTQDELAEKIFVTRTAVSKWETNKGYPSIDSLKQLSNLFGISIDQLIADDDIENKRLIDERKSRKFYWYAICCLVVATVSSIVTYFAKVPYLGIISIIGVIGYVICGFLSKPKYKRISARKMIVPYVISRLVILAIVIIIMITTIMHM